MIWIRWLVSRRTALWVVLTAASVVVMVGGCFAGDVAIGLAATYRPHLHVIRIFQYTDVVLFLGYRAFSRSRDPGWLRVLGIVGRWLWVPFGFARVLAGAAVLMLPASRLSGGAIVLIAPLVMIVPFVAGYAAWVAGGHLSRLAGQPVRVFSIPMSGRAIP